MVMLIGKFHKLISSKTVWITFMGIVVVSFVFWGTALPEPEDVNRFAPAEMDGEPISSEEFQIARRNIYLSLVLAYGDRIPRNLDRELIDDGAWNRLIALRKAKDLGFTVSNKEVVNYIQSQPSFAIENKFSKAMYNSFVANTLNRQGFGNAEFENHIRENLLISRLRRMVSQSVLIAPMEVMNRYRMFSDSFEAEFVEISGSNLTEEVTLTDEEAQAYFEENPNQFKTPEMVRVKYVRFPLADHFEAAKAKVEESDILDYYTENSNDFLVAVAPVETNLPPLLPEIPSTEPAEEPAEEPAAETGHVPAPHGPEAVSETTPSQSYLAVVEPSSVTPEAAGDPNSEAAKEVGKAPKVLSFDPKKAVEDAAAESVSSEPAAESAVEAKPEDAPSTDSAPKSEEPAPSDPPAEPSTEETPATEPGSLPLPLSADNLVPPDLSVLDLSDIDSAPPQMELKPLEEVRDEILQILTEKEALIMASEIAQKFMLGLIPERNEAQPDFDQVAKAMGLDVLPIDPFSRTDAPPIEDAGFDFTLEAFSRTDTPDHYFSDIIKGEEALYLLALIEQVPPRVPDFEDEKVKKRAHELGLEIKKRETLTEFANKIREDAVKAIKEEKTFTEALKPHSLEPTPTGEFTRSTGIESNIYSSVIINGVTSRNEGEFSELLPAGPESVILALVTKRSPGDPSAYDAVKPEIVMTMRRDRVDVLFEQFREDLKRRTNFKIRDYGIEEDEDAEEGEEGEEGEESGEGEEGEETPEEPETESASSGDASSG